MTALLLVIYCLLLAGLAWKNFRLAIGLIIISLPAYLVRFQLGPFPTTLLECSFFILLLVWLIKYLKTDLPLIKNYFQKNKLLFFSMVGLLFFSFLSIFLNGASALDCPKISPGSGILASFGLWRAYFLEPIIFFVILLGRQKTIGAFFLTASLLLSTTSIIFVGLIQKLSNFAYLTPALADHAGGRITSLFTSPNAVGLYLLPILFLSLILLKNTSNKTHKYLYIFYFALILATLTLTKSVGAFIGLAAGLLLLLWLLKYKKIVIITIALGGIFLSATPAQIIFNSRSAYNRFLLWGFAGNYLAQSPRNFIFGAGLHNFYCKIQAPLFDPEKIEPHLYPHNIFLNFWAETGLLGLLSFAGIICSLLTASYFLYKKNAVLGAVLLSGLTALIVHGLVDVPYFKNDLAMLFWIIAAITIVSDSAVILNGVKDPLNPTDARDSSLHSE